MTNRSTRLRWLASYSSSALLLGACAAQAPSPSLPPRVADPIVAALSARLVGLAHSSPDAVELGHALVQPATLVTSATVDVESCALAETQVNEACSAVVRPELGESCWGYTTFFFAHTTPRCAGRLEFFSDNSDWSFPHVVTFDLDGEAFGEAPLCGNSVIDSGEACDDGNLEPWDGCDATCQSEPFNGCEAVIEESFVRADLAWIDRQLWQSPRSHLMVHAEATALRAMTPALCVEAHATAETACLRLERDMPFVGWCFATTARGSDETGDYCAVRMNVGFSKVAPESGVFTTALPGLLTFRIR